MNCPWCENEMQFGEVLCDGRSGVRFQPEGKKLTFIDSLCGTGVITAAHMKWVRARIPAHYCDRCGKMVIETKVTK
ncbi:MAG: hypothetical protein E7320_01945 [Clostridiales bacterium]|nr:hypothetical protein [Clostridiales bacterium]